jgi:hypothetical protein
LGGFYFGRLGSRATAQARARVASAAVFAPCKLLPVARRNFNILNPQPSYRSVATVEHSMARNFGVHRHFNPSVRSPVWPLWVVAIAAIAVINAATFLPLR